MLVFLLLFAFVLYFFFHNFYEKRRNLPHGPTPLPFLGNLHQLNRNDFAKTLANWGKEFGPVFTFWMGPEPNVVITDYELIKDALTKHGEVFSGRPISWINEQLNGGRYGIVFTDGEIWRNNRRFSLQVLRDIGVGTCVVEAKIMTEIEKLFAHVDYLIEREESSQLDPEVPILLCIGNIISSIIVGHTFEIGDPKLESLKLSIGELFQLLRSPEACMLSSYPWIQSFPLFARYSKYQRIIELRNKLMRFTWGEVNEFTKTFDPCNEQTTFVGAYMKMLVDQGNKENRESFNRWQMMMTVSDTWIAGLETTVTTLQWGLLYMIHYPEIQQKVHEEILSVLEGREVTMSDKLNLPYTVATVQEIQRMANISSVNIPHAVTQNIDFHGNRIKKGTTILPQISSVMMDPKYFPNPETFDPTRFLDEFGKTVKKVEQFIPFSMGKRQCMGESLARMELFLIFTSLMHKFRFDPVNQNNLPSLDGIFGITRRPQKFRIHVTRR